MARGRACKDCKVDLSTVSLSFFFLFHSLWHVCTLTEREGKYVADDWSSTSYSIQWTYSGAGLILEQEIWHRGRQEEQRGASCTRDTSSLGESFYPPDIQRSSHTF